MAEEACHADIILRGSNKGYSEKHGYKKWRRHCYMMWNPQWQTQKIQQVFTNNGNLFIQHAIFRLLDAVMDDMDDCQSYVETFHCNAYI